MPKTLMSGLGLALTVVLAAFSAQAAERLVSGEVTYRERVALPEGARVIVEARAPDGRLLAEHRAATEGRQVPIGFSLDLPQQVEATLRAAIAEGGRVDWVSEEIAVEAGSEDLVLPEMMLRRHVPLAFESRLRCGEREIRFGVLDELAVIKVDSRRVPLAPEITASGSRFADPRDSGTWIWTRGDTALVSLAGEELPECVLAVPAQEFPYRAQGNEPFWNLVIEAGQVRLSREMGGMQDEFPLPQAAAEGAARVFRRKQNPHVEIRIAARLCRDTMTGMPYPDTVNLVVDELRLDGCGGSPYGVLTGGTWQVEDIGGQGVIDGSDTQMEFLADRAVAGKTGCNRYRAAVEITGESFGFGNAAVTMMACAEALMTQERAFLDALGTVQRFDVDPTGALLLLDAEGRPVIRAHRG